MDLTTVSRRVVLGVLGNRAMTSLITRYGLSLGAGRFVAGQDRDGALQTIAEINEDGLLATADHLGESVLDEGRARDAAAAYIDLLNAIRDRGAGANVSLKLTQMGLDIAPALAEENLRPILDRARDTGNFVRIDMEDSSRTQVTIDIFTRVLADYGPGTVGLVIQAYLYRSEVDVAMLGQLGANLRLCKGAYAEPRSVAYPRKRDVDSSFLDLIRMHLGRGCHTAIATHDDRIIRRAIEFIRAEGVDEGLYEFQMLHGIRPGLQRDLAAEGYRVRVYVPYGPDWYPYFIRRLAERPANVLFMASNLLKR